MTAEIIQFVPKANPKLIEAHAIEIMNIALPAVYLDTTTGEYCAPYTAPEKDPA